MKKFIIKNTILILIAIVLPIIPKIYYDTFNVFHWSNIRFTNAEPNKNFIKTKYILKNSTNFNAFVFGSSRVGYLPKQLLPKTVNEKTLNWYNMTHAMGIPAEHYETLKTFKNNNVSIDMVIIGFDNIAMYTSIEQHRKDLIRLPFQIYEDNKWKFYCPYLTASIDKSIVKQISEYDKKNNIKNKEVFYTYGVPANIEDFSLGENPDMTRFSSNHLKMDYTQKNAYKDIEKISHFCKENGIKLILFTNPIFESTFKDAVDHGYLDFLKSVAKNCDFYNFSGYNNYTKNPAYYFESSHYRPALGLLIEKILFGTEEERNQIRKDAGDELWGIRVNAENIDFVISSLKEKMQCCSAKSELGLF